MSDSKNDLTETLRQQYDAPMYEALLLVFGDNIHHAVFESPHDSFEQGAAHANQMLAEAAVLEPNMRVLETACGVGGAARYLARHFDVEVVATNLSEGQLAIAEKRTTAAGLQQKISYEYADFNDLPYANDEFDCYWSQDSWLYSEQKHRMIAEAYRVLAPGGRLVFSDIVVNSSVDDARSRGFLARIHAPAMWKVEDYETALPQAGFTILNQVDWTPNLEPSLHMLCSSIRAKKEQMAAIAGADEVADTIARFETWHQAAHDGSLRHVFFAACKPT